MGEIHIASLNVNEARDVREKMEIYKLIWQKNLTVLFMQETHSDHKNPVEWFKEWNSLPFLGLTLLLVEELVFYLLKSLFLVQVKWKK